MNTKRKEYYRIVEVSDQGEEGLWPAMSLYKQTGGQEGGRYSPFQRTPLVRDWHLAPYALR